MYHSPKYRLCSNLATASEETRVGSSRIIGLPAYLFVYERHVSPSLTLAIPAWLTDEPERQGRASMNAELGKFSFMNVKPPGE